MSVESDSASSHSFGLASAYVPAGGPSSSAVQTGEHAAPAHQQRVPVAPPPRAAGQPGLAGAPRLLRERGPSTIPEEATDDAAAATPPQSGAPPQASASPGGEMAPREVRELLNAREGESEGGVPQVAAQAARVLRELKTSFSGSELLLSQYSCAVHSPLPGHCIHTLLLLRGWYALDCESVAR